MTSSPPPLYPLLFAPVYKDYLWGGDAIGRRFGREVPAGPVAESWEISAHPDGESVISNGPLAGRSLAEAGKTYGASLLGTRAKGHRFPLLIKLLDARERLSVQVHPNDDTAARFGGEAKTEMWYLVDADPGAAVFAGLTEGADAARFRRAVEANAFADVLQRIPVEAGDAIYIPGGRVHAIDAGCLILEVQQSSNTTYRIYDWGRVGADGTARELHLEQAVEVTDWEDHGDPRVIPKRIEAGVFGERWEVYQSPYFRMERLDLRGATDETGDPASFRGLFCAEGRVRLTHAGGEVLLPAGTSCLVPAALPGYRLEPETGEARVLAVGLPDRDGGEG